MSIERIPQNNQEHVSQLRPFTEHEISVLTELGWSKTVQLNGESLQSYMDQGKHFPNPWDDNRQYGPKSPIVRNIISTRGLAGSVIIRPNTLVLPSTIGKTHEEQAAVLELENLELKKLLPHVSIAPVDLPTGVEIIYKLLEESNNHPLATEKEEKLAEFNEIIQFIRNKPSEKRAKAAELLLSQKLPVNPIGLGITTQLEDSRLEISNINLYDHSISVGYRLSDTSDGYLSGRGIFAVVAPDK